MFNTILQQSEAVRVMFNTILQQSEPELTLTEDSSILHHVDISMFQSTVAPSAD